MYIYVVYYKHNTANLFLNLYIYDLYIYINPLMRRLIFMMMMMKLHRHNEASTLHIYLLISTETLLVI